jgi:hypothetical protein
VPFGDSPKRQQIRTATAFTAERAKVFPFLRRPELRSGHYFSFCFAKPLLTTSLTSATFSTDIKCNINVTFAIATADRYMALYEKGISNYSLMSNLADMTPTQAYRALGVVKGYSEHFPAETPPLPEGVYDVIYFRHI